MDLAGQRILHSKGLWMSKSKAPVGLVVLACIVIALVECQFLDTDGILDLAHTLHLQTVAEGIETECQATLLAEHRCDDGQGFLWARSLAPESAGRLLRDGLPGPTLGACRARRQAETAETAEANAPSSS